MLPNVSPFATHYLGRGEGECWKPVGRSGIIAVTVHRQKACYLLGNWDNTDVTEK
jgi:hypothetical protein